MDINERLEIVSLINKEYDYLKKVKYTYDGIEFQNTVFDDISGLVKSEMFAVYLLDFIKEKNIFF
ncbi:MAG: hypothetical protein U0L85_06135 [Bacilli bacterium]|nr:hypothetical protein [Bacilli bacterium]